MSFLSLFDSPNTIVNFFHVLCRNLKLWKASRKKGTDVWLQRLRRRITRKVLKIIRKIIVNNKNKKFTKGTKFLKV